ncbi:multiprotein-bridging factor 1 family protein [Natronomonas halophila]|uniref:helix-turn-helix domain-containing protein n=1 Tax=Natronomonas halophila TaxID=2747817 RepID=UPI0015B78D65|nr:multiprotein-bridging factor 1 family protein [Natronomonas halophila]QLD87012.1 multiprotein-bridging factor 1 family protein [Natronomonas halophila]
MAKYSTGGVGGDSSGACELCGAEDRSLETATVAGAELQVCSECARHGEEDGSDGSGGSSSGSDGREETNRRKKAAQNMAKLDDARKVDSDWQEETEYEDDPLPYLVRGYGDRVEQARQDAGLQTDELAAELGVDEEDIVAVEQGRAARAGVGGSLIEALEDELGIELAEE